MGSLYYGEGARFTFDDRLLTHLRTVILGKLNLQESLVFTWSGDGRQHSIWLHPAVSLRFEFDDEATPEINHAWIERLLALANSGSGLRIVEEPEGEG
ncbi:hypothetical protein J4H92_10680 [Leucobacter weissii]|uniref:DUF7882 domain-containing protein n=1 Tax=Leucobacter weissii TaxID=1983706 RepID=A0A939SAX7_9MICO|nr:hypothetical protein [Leucobacter weissii]MBO1902412.1 hypothetical protein [Leucobacter weissii]